MIDLCKVFGVEEGEEFKFKLGEAYYKYIISCNELVYYDENKKEWVKSCKPIIINDLPKLNIIKLPKRKEFTDDELCILRNIDKESKWIARDESNNLYVYKNKPTKINRYWDVEYGERQRLKVFSHLFKSIQWEDEEPVYIDDYVERGVE
jgi:hypothetical protein